MQNDGGRYFCELRQRRRLWYNAYRQLQRSQRRRRAVYPRRMAPSYTCKFLSSCYHCCEFPIIYICKTRFVWDVCLRTSMLAFNRIQPHVVFLHAQLSFSKILLSLCDSGDETKRTCCFPGKCHNAAVILRCARGETAGPETFSVWRKWRYFGIVKWIQTVSLFIKKKSSKRF